jgi:hypothetical protein
VIDINNATASKSGGHAHAKTKAVMPIERMVEADTRGFGCAAGAGFPPWPTLFVIVDVENENGIRKSRT